MIASCVNDEQRAVLRAVCDTVYPRIERDDDPDGFWARSASDMGLPEAVEDLIEQIPDETIRGGLEQLLDVLGQQGFLRMPSQLSREQLLRNLVARVARRRGGRLGARRHDALPRLRRARSRDRAEPELEDVRLPGPGRAAAAGAEAARGEDARRTARRSRPTSAWSAPARAAA